MKSYYEQFFLLKFSEIIIAKNYFKFDVDDNGLN